MVGASAVVVAAVIIAAAAVLLFPRGQERGSEQYSVGSQIAPHLLGGSDRRGLPYLFYEPSSPSPGTGGEVGRPAAAIRGEAGRFAAYNPGLPLASARPQGAEGGQFRCGVTRDTALHTYRGAPWLSAPSPCPSNSGRQTGDGPPRPGSGEERGRAADFYELWRTYGGARGWTMSPYY